MQVATSALLPAWAMHLSNRANTSELRAAHVPTRTLRSIEMTSARAQHTTPAMAWPVFVAPRFPAAGERDDAQDQAHQPAHQGQRKQHERDPGDQTGNPDDQGRDA